MADGATNRMTTGMAGVFAVGTEDACRLLNAGARIGSLSDAFLRRWLAGGLAWQRVAVDAVEFDGALRGTGIEMVKLCMAFVALWGRMCQQARWGGFRALELMQPVSEVAR